MWYLLSSASLVADRILKKKAREDRLPDLLTPGGSIEFHPIENEGLAGSSLRRHPTLVKWLSCAALGVNIPALLRGFRNQNRPAKCGIALLLTGSGSNIYDRLKNGSVTDMLRFPKAPGKLKTLVFNLADFMILLGALLTILFSPCQAKRKKL